MAIRLHNWPAIFCRMVVAERLLYTMLCSKMVVGGFQGADPVTFDKGEENLRITPLGEHAWKLSMVKGQRAPEVQGWYSPSNNLIVPSLTARDTKQPLCPRLTEV